jgi:hypothetical protein
MKRSEGCAQQRWIADRALASLNPFHRLQVRNGPQADTYHACTTRGCARLT